MEMSLGATYLGDGRCRFLVWAPLVGKVEVRVIGSEDRIVPLSSTSRGYHDAVIDGIEAGTEYFYRLDERKDRPDPASRYQPNGVHKTSQVVDPSFNWQDQHWCGIPLRDYIIYEMHVGTFTSEGTFDAALGHLDRLKRLGITAIELMPVAQFPGSRNWGYDGVHPFAVQNSYGGPQSLKRFVNACHQQGLAAILDVVYNHLGPEGNYLADYAPYFTDRYRTPWGPAINYDGPDSDDVRRFFLENALYWIRDFHFDALRLDAIHAIYDASATPFLEELGVAVHEEAERLHRRIYVIPESDLGDSRVVTTRELGGYGLDAQWSDDFHHALHTLLTGERSGYYQDFGRVADLAKAYREGYVYTGQYSAYRRCRHGNSSRHLAGQQFVVFAQNHDQVGNRLLGDRLSQRVSFEKLKLAAGAVILSPFVPLLFMGEEYGETAPFQYFVSHTDSELIEATRKGRREEFAAFNWQGEIPDPLSETTFLNSKLEHGLRSRGRHRTLGDLYRELIHLRCLLPALADLNKENQEVVGWEKEKVLVVRRWSGTEQVLQIFNFADIPVTLVVPMPAGAWRRLLDTKEERWKGGGPSLPDRVDSGGEVKLTLPPEVLVVYSLSAGDTL